MPELFSNLRPRVCFISSRSGFVQDNEVFLVDWANGRLIQHLAKRYLPVFSVAIFSDSCKRRNHDFEIKVAKVYPLPFPFSYSGGVKNFFKIAALLKKIEKENDLLIVQLPFIGFPALLLINKPTVYHLCANVLTASSNPFKYNGISRLVAMTFACVMHAVFKQLFKRKHSKLVVNGNELASVYTHYSPRPVVSSSVDSTEIISADKVCGRAETEPFRILFIGRPSMEKGFHTLIDAFIQLREAGHPVFLDLLGVMESELNSILNHPVPLEYVQYIKFHGFVSWSDKFRNVVSSSHVLVMCSVSEGTPRVLIESRALGCPVIATRIGGITSSVTNEFDGLLIPAGDPIAVVQAVRRLHNEQLRKLLILNGLTTAKNHTVEKFADTFFAAVNELIKQNES